MAPDPGWEHSRRGGPSLLGALSLIGPALAGGFAIGVVTPYRGLRC